MGEALDTTEAVTMLTMKEAALSVAHLYEALGGEVYVAEAYAVNGEGERCSGYQYGITAPSAERWCAAGALAVAAGVGLETARDYLRSAATPDSFKNRDPERINNLGITHAINLLRKAARLNRYTPMRG